MSRDSTVIPFRQPDAIDDPLTDLAREGALDRLAAASFAELIRRGRKPPIQDETSFKRRVEDATASLTPGRLNAVRAAFRAGVTPSKIARQFAIPHSDVRKALAGKSSTRAPSRD